MIPNSPLENAEEFVSVARAAVMLGRPENTVRRWLRLKKIHGFWSEEFKQWAVKKEGLEIPEKRAPGRKPKGRE